MEDAHFPQPSPPARRTILVIDDHAMIHAVSVAMLEHLGYRALVASNGDDGIDLFRGHVDAILCVLLDMTMPGMSGLETLAALRSIDPDVSVVLMSGYGADQTVMAQVGGPMIRFLAKPFTVAELAEQLQQAQRGSA